VTADDSAAAMAGASELGAAAQPAAAAALRPPAAQLAKWKPGTVTAGPRLESGAVPLCACADAGFNSPACFLGVTQYCSTQSELRPSLAVCEAMSGFVNRQNVTAGKVASAFLMRECSLRISRKPPLCPCLQVPGAGARAHGGEGLRGGRRGPQQAGEVVRGRMQPASVQQRSRRGGDRASSTSGWPLHAHAPSATPLAPAPGHDQ
jgi:hypothetical protein